MDDRNAEHSLAQQQDQMLIPTDDIKLSKGIRIIDDIMSNLDVRDLQGLVSFWLGTGTNLVLGGHLTQLCVNSVTKLFYSLSESAESREVSVRRLFENSSRRNVFSSTSTLAEFCNEICRDNIRWETLIVALVAFGKATVDVPYYPRLYSTRAQLKNLQQLVTQLSDSCLELVLSLGRVSDLLVVCQYENWIIHSITDGDASLDSWRRLGDVISSVLYLGYHQLSKAQTDTPKFLTDMRKTSFARVYSDDKNVACFLGRPPRLSSTFCCFQLPERPSSSGRGEVWESSDVRDRPLLYFDEHEAVTLNTSIRWAALCARLKEKALEIVHAADTAELLTQKTASVTEELNQLWHSLPVHMRLEGSLQPHRDRSSFEQDFLLFARLDWLQVGFLLRSSELSQHAIGASRNDTMILKVSGEMLSLTVEAIVSREYLVNSGTDLVWKVSHYGLPAAGMISLALLQQSPSVYNAVLAIHKIVQSLGTFVAEIQGESIVRSGDPNYALLHQAAQTIDRLLEAFLSGVLQDSANRTSCNGVADGLALNDSIDASTWTLPSNTDSLGYEFDFWRLLGEHPTLLGHGDVSLHSGWPANGDLDASRF